jgi:A118 family predicted phage portal protein
VTVPLPDSSIDWPPPAHVDALARMADYDAWWAGDPDRLGKRYTTRSGGLTYPDNRPSQYRGGLVGTMSRWFWGRPVPVGEKRTGVHMPLPADIATASADLLFAEPPRYVFEKDTNREAWEVLDDQMRLTSRLHEAAEVCSPFGGVYLRTTFDKGLWPHPITSAVHADNAYPTFKWGRLTAVTFVRELSHDGNEVVRYLERYELDGTPDSRKAWGFNGVYEGTPDKLGRKRDLNYFEDTKGLPEEIDLQMPVLPVAYVPNMMPSREDRGSDLGRSDFEGVLGLFDALDTTASSLLRDIRLGKSRAFIPQAFLSSMGRGAGATWDPDNEIYTALDISPTSAAAEISVEQFNIRVADHVASMTHWSRTAVETAGYSASTFGLDRDGGDPTATEVNDRKSRSNRTRRKKTGYWGEGMRDHAAAVLWTAKTQFGLDVDPEDLPRIEWPEIAAPDPLAKAQTLQALRDAQLISRFLGVKAQHDDWDDDEIEEEVARIEAEQPQLPNPDEFGPGFGSSGDPSGESEPVEEPADEA